MICGKCNQKTSEIELYCKICGADLQIFSSEKKSSAATTEPTHSSDGYPASSPTTSPLPDEIKIEPTISPEQNLSVPSFLSDNNKSPVSSHSTGEVTSVPYLQDESVNDFKIPGLDNNREDKTPEKPLYNKYFLDEEGKST